MPLNGRFEGDQVPNKLFISKISDWFNARMIILSNLCNLLLLLMIYYGKKYSCNLDNDLGHKNTDKVVKKNKFCFESVRTY